MLADNGLAAPSMHCGMADAQKDLQQRIDYAQAIGCAVSGDLVSVDRG